MADKYSAFGGDLPPSSLKSRFAEEGGWYNAAFTIGSLAGIPIRIHALLPLWAVCKIFIGLMYFGTAFAFLEFILDGPILLGTVFLHVLAQCLMARYYGGEIDTITLWPFGGMSFIGHMGNPKEDIMIAAAGPASHLVQALFWLILGAELVPSGALTTSPTGAVTVDASDYAEVYNNFWLQMCSQALLLQLLLFWINTTVPAYPLDGSRILVNCLSLCGVGLETAAMTMALLALLSGALLFLYGLLASSMTTFFGCYVCYEAFRVRQKVKNAEAELHPLFHHYSDRLERSGPGVSGPPGPVPGVGGAPGAYGAL